jgi:hypothetical protein
MRVGSVWACAVACAVAAVGCGPEAAKDTRPDIYVRGKLMDGNKPWVFEEKKAALPPGVGQPPGVPGAPGAGSVQMAFLSVEGSDVVYGVVDPTAGTFTAKGLKAGRYKIALYGGSSVPGAGDPFKGQFTQDKTKIVRDLKNGDDITIDVSKPTG